MKNRDFVRKDSRTGVDAVVKGSLALIVCSILIAGFQPPKARSETQSVLTLDVRDESGAVVPNAEVKLIKRPEHQGLTFHTDSAGAVSLHLPTGSYQVSVSMKGFKTATKELSLNNATQQTVVIVLRVGGCPVPDPCPVVPEKAQVPKP